MTLEIITRNEARKRGLKYYHTGKPCKRGHYSKRYARNCGCVECQHELGHRIYYGDIEKFQQSSRDYYATNKEACIKQRKEYRSRPEIKERYRVNQREYYKNNPIAKVSNRMRTHLKKCLKLIDHPKSNKTFKMLGYSAQELKESLESKFVGGMSWEKADDWCIDHIYPIDRYFREGVTDHKIINALDNLAPMWFHHNSSKRNKTMREWLEIKGVDSEEYSLYSKYLDTPIDKVG